MNTKRFLGINFKAQHLGIAVRSFTYGVMVVSTIALTTLAIFYAMGYRFNQTNFRVEQGGLLQLRSQPEGATVVIDGQTMGNRTPSREYLSAGKHSIEMREDGYQTWRRDFELLPGQLLWLDYTRLIPSTLATSQLQTFTAVSDAAFSPDHRFALVHTAADQPTYTLLDLSDETKPVASTITIPTDQLTLKDGKIGSLSIIEWDFNSRSVLLRHDSGDTHEVIRIDRTKPSEAVNVSRLFGLNIDEVHFAGGNQNVVYAQTDGVLRRLDIDGASASAALVSGIKSFVLYGDSQIAFVAQRQLSPTDAAKNIVGLYRDGKETIVRSYPADTNVQIAYSEYFRHQYLAIDSGGDAVEILRDPASKAIETPVFVKLDTTQPVKWLSFSGNGRILAAGAGSDWRSYDLEVASSYSGHFDGSDLITPPRWLDDFYLWASKDGRLVIVEFDGQNARDITSAMAFGVSLSQNGKSLFSLTQSAGGVSLQATRLVVK